MFKVILLFFITFNTYIAYNQNVFPIDTLNNIITFKSVKNKINIEGKKKTEKSFFIDIPDDIKFKYYKHSVAEKIHGLIFTNGTVCFVVQINKKKYRKDIICYGDYKKLKQQYIPEKFVIVEDIQIKDDLYCGYYYYKNYFVYYYNVPFENIELYNTALKSIRRKNKH